MSDEQDEYGDMPSVKPDGGTVGTGHGFLPPLDVTLDLPEFRYAKLSRIVAEHVLPHLMALHEPQPGSPDAAPARSAEIAELARLLLGPENDDAENYILRLKEGGVSLDDLHAELLEPTARRLGELWEDDTADFVDVTIGVSRLQRLVHVFEGLDQIPGYDDKRRVLLACAPGEQHSLGSTIVQKFLRSAGWHVWTCASPRIEEAAELAAREWFGVIGFSLSSDVHVDALAAAIAQLRQVSLNRRVAVMVGGSAVSRDPSIVARLGADGTASNGPATVILAKKLLAESLA